MAKTDTGLAKRRQSTIEKEAKRLVGALMKRNDALREGEGMRLEDSVEALAADKAIETAVYALGLEGEAVSLASENTLRRIRAIGTKLPGVIEHGGDRRSKSAGDTLKLADLGLTKGQSSRWQKVARMADFDFEDYCEKTAAKCRRLSMADLFKDPALTGQDDDDSDEQFTPLEYIEAALEVMGSIDLDPASCEEANETVQAEQSFTKEDDGLAQDWFGNVWLNPPFRQPIGAEFVAKLLTEIEAEHVPQCIAIQNASTDVQWFHDLASRTHICLPRGRIGFIHATKGKRNQNRYGQALFYYGPNHERFEEVFGEFGLVGKLHRVT